MAKTNTLCFQCSIISASFETVAGMEQGNNFSQTLAIENGSQPQVDNLYLDNWAYTLCPEFGLVIYSEFTHSPLVEHLGLVQKLSMNSCLVQLKHVFVL